jgi:hypothetical protein
MPTNKPSASNANNAGAAFSAGLVLRFYNRKMEWFPAPMITIATPQI